MESIKNKYDFVAFIEVINGNPNGDPDAGNMPRVDPETGIGIITDVCLKRKIRNYVDIVKGSEPTFDIYIKQGEYLNAKEKKAFDVNEATDKNKKDKSVAIHDYMCENYYDIRTFGAVLTSLAGVNGGQIRGPVQLGFARSVDPVYPRDITITRCVVTTAEDAAKKNSTMGSKSIISYGLYRVEGYVSANLAAKTGFSEDDLELLWKAILNMYEDDHSASRGNTSVRKLIIFKHDSHLGNCPSYELFESIEVKQKDGVEVPRKYSDYEITINRNAIPKEVEVIEK